ncbi:uncharacterized protein JCM6883_005772 [Sporobolomyces salmoneus]|uniref:uncharacterized protein n=1 Tax=Sporobolomyces salmoneus TaxID=183962 RepID=UPI003178A3C5
MGLKDSLGFGKHATFAAEIKIHELLQVPLRDAKFRLKWHFKDATTHGPAVTAFAESLVNRSDDSHQLSTHFAEAGRRLLQPVNALVDSALGDNNKLETSRSQSPGGGGNSSGNEGMRTPNILSPIMSPQLDSTTPNPNKTPMPQSIQFSSPFSRSSPPNPDDSSNLPRPSRTRTVDTVGAGSTYTDETSLSRRRGGGEVMHAPPMESSSHHHRLEPKGTTNFVPLRSHTATFERTIVCPVQISARQNPQNHRYLLQPSSFKISIKQEGIDHSGHHQPEEKIGEVNLDLSQFVGKEVKSRRFLLANCKTNSILRITVKMEFLEGENHYVAPPLVNGRILSTSKSNASSARGSPLNRSSASLATSPRKATSSLSHGFSPSLQMSRSASTASSVNSSSASLNERSRTTSKNDSLNNLTEQEFKKHRKGKKLNRIVGPNGRREGWHPPASSDYSGCQHGERNATDIIESIFNRQPETPMTGKAAWHTHSGANGKPNMTPRQSYVGTAKGSKENGHLQVEKAAQSKKAAWSIRSFKRSKNKNPPQRQASLDTPSIAPSTSTTSETNNPSPSVSIQAPTPSSPKSHDRPFFLERASESFASSTGSTQRAISPNGSPLLGSSTNSASLQQTPRPRPLSLRATSYGSLTSMPPPALSASQSSSASSTRPLSVRFQTDEDDSSLSLSLKSRTSIDNFSQHSDHSSSSVQGLGLSDSTLANGFITPRSSLELNRSRSNNSFNSVVTPPSPERTPMRRRIASSDSWR